MHDTQLIGEVDNIFMTPCLTHLFFLGVLLPGHPKGFPPMALSVSSRIPGQGCVMAKLSAC